MSAGQRAQWAARRSGLPSGGTRRWRAILEAGAVRTLAALPQGLTARLAGAPTMIDGQRLDPEVQLALGLLALASEQPLETLSPAQARAQVSRDASLFQGPPIPLRATEELTIPAGHGPIPARLHVPEPAPGEGGLLVYFHGGGFVVGDLDSHDNTCRFLASQAGVRVLSVHYRRAPEHPFPAAAEDALTAFLFACGEAHVLGAEAGRIAVGGDSAGGNLAAVVAQQARTGDTPPPALALLIYPWLDLSRKRRSYELFGDGFFLTEAQLDWYRGHYVPSEDVARDERCSPLLCGDLGGLPPTYIATAGFDPLRDEGEEYAAMLRAAGSPVALRRHSGLIHGFANAMALDHAGRDALLAAAGALRMALAGRATRERGSTPSVRAHV